MAEIGMAMMGSGARAAARTARAKRPRRPSPARCSRTSISPGAHGILVNVTAGMDLSIGEFQEVGHIVKQFASDDATVVVGTVIDPEHGQRDARHRGRHRPRQAGRRPHAPASRVQSRGTRLRSRTGRRPCGWCVRSRRWRRPTTPCWTSRRCSGSARWATACARSRVGGPAGYSGVPAPPGRLSAGPRNMSRRCGVARRVFVSAALGVGVCRIAVQARRVSRRGRCARYRHIAWPGGRRVANAGQRTLKNSIRATGVGLHTGKKV